MVELTHRFSQPGLVNHELKAAHFAKAVQSTDRFELQSYENRVRDTHGHNFIRKQSNHTKP
jgi:hypothetical protein